MPIPCPQCGAQNADNAMSCYSCGNALNMYTQGQGGYAPPPYNQPQPPFMQQQPGQQGPYGQQPFPGGYQQQPMGGVGYGNPEIEKLQKKAKSAMICGIIGVPCFGIILGPIAIINGMQAKSGLTKFGITDGQGQALAGIILGCVAIVVFILGIIIQIANS